MVNDEFKDALRDTLAKTKEAIISLEDLVNLGIATNNRNLEAEAQLKVAKEQVALWEIALAK